MSGIFVYFANFERDISNFLAVESKMAELLKVMVILNKRLWYEFFAFFFYINLTQFFFVCQTSQ